MSRAEIRGSCFCRAVSYAFTGPPALSAYCHCTNCQRLSGCPFVHTIHAASGTFRWTHNGDQDLALNSLDVFRIPSKPHKTRFRCKVCGACVAGYNNIRDRYSIWGAQLDRPATAGNQDADQEDRAVNWEEIWEMVKPTTHIFYGTRMLDVKDGLGKWGGYEGTSEMLEE